jgi:hypothetical protein
VRSDSLLDFVPKYIGHFPTPGAQILVLKVEPLEHHLLRAVAHLTDDAYAHGRPVARFGKNIFDECSPLRTQFIEMWGEERLHKEFGQRILGARRSTTCSPSPRPPPRPN